MGKGDTGQGKLNMREMLGIDKDVFAQAKSLSDIMLKLESLWDYRLHLPDKAIFLPAVLLAVEKMKNGEDVTTEEQEAINSFGSGLAEAIQKVAEGRTKTNIS